MLTRDNRGFWVVVAVVLFAWGPGMDVRSSAVSTHELNIAPSSGSAPLTVRLTGRIQVHGQYCWTDVRIHWGDGEIFEYLVTFEADLHVDTTKTYSSHGLYRVIRERVTYCTDGSVYTFVDSNTVITVTDPVTDPCGPGAPALSLGWEHYVVGLDEHKWQGRVTSAIDPWVNYLVGATIDFDDGAGIQPLTWVWNVVGVKWVTDWRIYLLDGDHTAIVENKYDKDGCEFDVISTVDFTTSGWPLVPVEETTWGRVKALYQ